MKFSVTVTLKKDVLDPQGKVVQNTLLNMGMNNLKSLRQGKHFEIEVDESDHGLAAKKIGCKKYWAKIQFCHMRRYRIIKIISWMMDNI